jgi:hypothetical protein
LDCRREIVSIVVRSLRLGQRLLQEHSGARTEPRL